MGLALEVVPSCLYLALGGNSAGSTGVVCESLIKEMTGVWAVNWLVCLSKMRSQGSHSPSLGISYPGSVSRIKALHAKASKILKIIKYSQYSSLAFVIRLNKSMCHYLDC